MLLFEGSRFSLVLILGPLFRLVLIIQLSVNFKQYTSFHMRNCNRTHLGLVLFSYSCIINQLNYNLMNRQSTFHLSLLNINR
jgi:hypothetical protein